VKAWAEFYPHVLPHVIGCPNPVVNQALRDAAREFCLDTKAWQETEDFEADGAINRYYFDVTGQTELVQVVRASVAGKDLDIYGRGKLPADWETEPPCERSLYHLNEEEYLLFPLPSAGQAISVTLAVRPSIAGTGVGDVVFKKHAEAIASGAKYRLLKMPRQDWTDLDQAAICKREFDKGVSDAANRDFMHTRPATRRVKSWG
jgi:hypothetical protein